MKTTNDQQSPVRVQPVVSRRVIVTQDLVNEIIRRAKGSHWGLGKAKCSTSLDQYAEQNTDALALLMVNGWEAKYDLVSLFAAAVSVIEEKAANDRVKEHFEKGQT